MKEQTTQARLAKISRLLDKLDDHRTMLDMERASAEWSGILNNLRQRLQELADRFEPYNHE